MELRSHTIIHCSITKWYSSLLALYTERFVPACSRGQFLAITEGPIAPTVHFLPWYAGWLFEDCWTARFCTNAFGTRNQAQLILHRWFCRSSDVPKLTTLGNGYWDIFPTTTIVIRLIFVDMQTLSYHVLKQLLGCRRIAQDCQRCYSHT